MTLMSFERRARWIWLSLEVHCFHLPNLGQNYFEMREFYVRNAPHVVFSPKRASNILASTKRPRVAEQEMQQAPKLRTT